MQHEIKNVTLSFQCSENWNEMKIVDGKRLCDTCQHHVIDFRDMSDEEFQRLLKNSTHAVCGRFKKSQMSSDFLKYAAATLIAASSVGGASCITEEPPLEAPVIEQPTLELKYEPTEFVTMGIVFTPLDSTAHDSTMTESNLETLQTPEE